MSFVPQHIYGPSVTGHFKSSINNTALRKCTSRLRFSTEPNKDLNTQSILKSMRCFMVVLVARMERRGIRVFSLLFPGFRYAPSGLRLLDRHGNRVLYRKTVSGFSWLASFRQCSSNPVMPIRLVARLL